MKQDIKFKLEKFFSESSNLLEYKKDQILINITDEDINTIYFLKSGYVKQMLTTPDGNEMLLNIFKPYSYFPMMIYMSNLKNKYIFTALTDIKFYKANANDVLNFIKEDKEILFDLTTRYANGLNGLLAKIESLMFTDSYHKLALLLDYLVKEFGKDLDGGKIINIHLTHEELASWLGIQRETLSKQFEILKNNGVIEYLDKLIFVKNLTKLKKIIE